MSKTETLKVAKLIERASEAVELQHCNTCTVCDVLDSGDPAIMSTCEVGTLLYRVSAAATRQALSLEHQYWIARRAGLDLEVR